MTRLPFAFCLAVVLWAPVAFAQSSPGVMQPMSGMNHPTANAADQSMRSGMAQMNQAMAGAPMTGNADQDFVSMMIPHHAGAISMAESELRYGHDPYLRKLAQRIVAAQDQEIAEMKNWQARHPAK